MAWLGWAGKEVAQHAGFWCFESENLNSFFPSLCRGAVVVSFAVGCGERERRGSAEALARDYTFRRPSERSLRCYSLCVTAVPPVPRRRCNFAELSARRRREMRLSSRIHPATRASVNSSEIHDTHPLVSLLSLAQVVEPTKLWPVRDPIRTKRSDVVWCSSHGAPVFAHHLCKGYPLSLGRVHPGQVTHYVYTNISLELAAGR